MEARQNWDHIIPAFDNQTIWCHMASLGEYEQVLPVLLFLKQTSDRPIVLSFFSPSGYEIVKKKDQWPNVFYLPLDRKRDVVRWYNRINPTLIIYVKYDLWHNFLKEGFRRGIPTILVSALFTESKYYFKWYGKWMLDHLKRMNMTFVQNDASLALAQKQGLNAVKAGDTRVDRSIKLPFEQFSDERIQEFCAEQKTMIWASTHEKDDDILLSWWKEKHHEDWRILWAPHHVNEEYISCLVSKYGSSFQLHSGQAENKLIMLIDSIGVLKYAYRFADVVYMGGGFDSGIHNLLEPMSYGAPCIFGPHYKTFPEAVFLIENDLGFCIKSKKDLDQVFYELQNEPLRQTLGKQYANYLSDHGGATKLISQWITQNVLVHE